MYRSIVIGDTHFRYLKGCPNYLEQQIEAVQKIIDAHPDANSIIFLGDVFHHRSPSPTEIIRVKQFFDGIPNKVYIIRGNHDSETKADDGVTALTLLANDNIEVITHYEVRKDLGWVFIPHYENEKVIQHYLDISPSSYITFGHFGYDPKWHNPHDIIFPANVYPAVLGHLHSFHVDDRRLVLGTPYSTAFTETSKVHYYLILSRDSRSSNYIFELEEIKHGIRYEVLDLESLELNKDYLKDPNYKTYLRVVVDELDPSVDLVSLRKTLLSDFSLEWVEFAYNPIIREQDPISKFNTEAKIEFITDDLIYKYVEEHTTTLTREELLEGLELLRSDEIK